MSVRTELSQRLFGLIEEEAIPPALAAHAVLMASGRFKGRGPCFLNVTVMLDGHGPCWYRTSLVGHPVDWETPFERISDSKHAISVRTGKDTVDVPLTDRQPDDTQYWGSVVLNFPGGSIIVAISGLQPWFDEGLCGLIASLFKALLKDEGLIPRGYEPDRTKGPFLTEEYLEELRANAAKAGL